MYDIPQSPPTQPEAGPQFTETDEQHLKVLAILHYVFAALCTLGMCGGAVYIVLGNLFLAGRMPEADPSMSESETQFVGWLMIVIGGGITILLLVWAMLNVVAGLSLRRQRRAILCYITAGLNCASVPLGTLLGVFTFLVLFRPGVQARFRVVKDARERSRENDPWASSP